MMKRIMYVLRICWVPVTATRSDYELFINPRNVIHEAWFDHHPYLDEIRKEIPDENYPIKWINIVKREIEVTRSMPLDEKSVD